MGRRGRPSLDGQEAPSTRISVRVDSYTYSGLVRMTGTAVKMSNVVRNILRRAVEKRDDSLRESRMAEWAKVKP